MSLSKKPYRGTRDFFPPEKRVQDFMFEKMKQSAGLFGYESYDGPLLEEVALYLAKSGEELINEQIYSFTDRGDRHVAIRPEMTPTVARMVAQIHKEQAKPIRWFSIPNLMRYEKPQKGRLREHWQFNCDIFGAPGRHGEIEILQVAINLLNQFGANENHFEILLNDRAIVDTIFQKVIGANTDQCYRLYKIVDKAKKVPEEAVEKMFNETGLEAKSLLLFKEYLSINSFSSLKEFLSKYNQTENAKDFLSFIDQASTLGLDKYIIYDPSIVRGLDYYTGIVFEIFDKHPDNRRALCGGGAYENLLKIFNEQPLAGVGFGLGDVTLKDFLEVHGLLPDLSTPKFDIFVTFQDDNAQTATLNLAQEFRKIGLKVVTHFETLKFKKVFQVAQNKGVQFVILVGERELADNKFVIKNLESKEQFEFNFSDTKAAKDFLKK